MSDRKQPYIFKEPPYGTSPVAALLLGTETPITINNNDKTIILNFKNHETLTYKVVSIEDGNDSYENPDSEWTVQKEATQITNAIKSALSIEHGRFYIETSLIMSDLRSYSEE